MSAESSTIIDKIFRRARSYNAWTTELIEDETLRELYEILKWGPTSANSSPLRIVYVRTPEGKASLAPFMFQHNAAKVKEAPVTAILGYDTKFVEYLPKLFPHNPAILEMLVQDPAFAEETAFRNSSIQGGYFIVAARMLGLDVGPMSGFDARGVNETFFPGGRIKANFICCLGHSDRTRDLWPRLPRLCVREACSFR